MADPRLAPRAGDDGLVDGASGLVWEARPSDAPMPWSEAAASDWRLPSIDELMSVLVDLPPAHPCTPPAGRVLWSASESPFAAASQVRVVGCAPGPSYRVMLRDRLNVAWAWRVRRGPR
jgi:hypothetical protein